MTARQTAIAVVRLVAIAMWCGVIFGLARGRVAEIGAGVGTQLEWGGGDWGPIGNTMAGGVFNLEMLIAFLVPLVMILFSNQIGSAVAAPGAASVEDGRAAGARAAQTIAVWLVGAWIAWRGFTHLSGLRVISPGDAGVDRDTLRLAVFVASAGSAAEVLFGLILASAAAGWVGFWERRRWGRAGPAADREPTETQ